MVLNKVQLNQLCDSKKQIHIITRSPEQYENTALFGEKIEGVEFCSSVEEYLDDRTIQNFQNCCVVFDDMLDSN